MLNHVTLMGRLTRDPELRYTQAQTPVASFTVAVDRDLGEKQTDFIDCVAWKHTAEFAEKYLKKGTLVAVSGRLQSRKWQTKGGDNRTSWEVVANNIYFGESKRDAAPSVYSVGFSDMPPGTGTDNPFTGREAQLFLPDMDDDGELPF